MRLHHIELENFRQFKGRQKFNLQSSDDHPVSILFGANGSGKTTLLNAFTWALYGTVSDDVEVQERMVTDIVWRQASTGSSLLLAVELRFDHDGSTYSLKRRADVRKESDDQPRKIAPEVVLRRVTPDGQSEDVAAPQEMISSILPAGISRFFFFNGERIEKLVQKGAYSEIRHDIKALLNIKHVERALVDLPKVARKLSSTIKDSGDEVAGKLQEQIEAVEDQRDSALALMKSEEQKAKLFKEEEREVSDILRKHQSVAPLQEAREDAQAQLAQAREEAVAARSEQSRIVATRGFLAFSKGLLEQTEKVAESLHERGALPAPLKREFVDRLLDERECICGASLAEGSDAHANVQVWRARAGLQAVEAAWQGLNGQIPPMRSARDDLRASLQSAADRRTDAESRVGVLEAKVSELTGRLIGTNLEDVVRLDNKRVELEDLIQRCMLESRVAHHQYEEREKTALQLKNQLATAQMNNKSAAKARDRTTVVRNVEKALGEILEIRSSEMRERLESEVQQIFKQIVIRNYTPRLSKDLELTLHQDVDGVEMQVPKSTGENQILSLSFVAAVSKIARERPKGVRAEGEDRDVGTYPIVMDAAFGSLDKNYQKDISSALAKLAPQLVVLVSKSQGMGEVIKELRPHVSNIGVITVNTTSTRDVGEQIEVDGRSYDYIKTGAESNYSELKEIGR
ncbi:DNA sulfur modification protein DndD [Rhodococcus fascians]|uniref:AAA family ATPase n=1 Tax=Nocardiaceae TaxID=85025 RepID=UPI0024B9A805|nr:MULTISPECIES: AAA family ATPase [Rhodococcus]MDJ0427284.1 AAA family ATPase [Rhodococcus fascians]MDR6912602.1 DNA sulfur modification protein DndD [Rhodococcus sp. 3258]MDR6934329.1 DNA sulfur modification protein DndD [Rhodococcus fascians]